VVVYQKVADAHPSHRNVAVAPLEGKEPEVEAPPLSVLLVARDATTIFDVVQGFGHIIERIPFTNHELVEVVIAGRWIVGVDASVSAHPTKGTMMSSRG
jgi:hypothetical protein